MIPFAQNPPSKFKKLFFILNYTTPLVITGFEQLSSSICCRVMAGQSLSWKGNLGLAKGGQISKTCPHCDVTSRKPQIQSEQMFFSISTRRLAESVEGLNSSLARLSGELWDCKSLQKRGFRGI